MAGYPAHLERERCLAEGRTVIIRPIRAADEPGERRFLDRLAGETKKLRFMKFASALNAELVHFFTHIDYDRHMAFVCEYQEQLVGEARYIANPDGRSCEFGVVIADDWHHSGIAGLLMDALIEAAGERGFATMEGLVLRSNAVMLRFVEALGFELAPEPHEPTLVRAVKRLRSATAAATGRAG